MTSNSNVVDLTELRVARDASKNLTELMGELIKNSVVEISKLHGGKSDEWIEYKASTCTDVMLDMLAILEKPIQISLPDALSDQERAAIESAVITWRYAQNEICRDVFMNRLVALLGP